MPRSKPWSGATLLLASVLVGCGPAITDHVSEIADAPGYFFYDAGGNEKMILRQGDGQKAILVDSRVNGFVVAKGKLLVSRSPRTGFQDDQGVMQSKIADRCEYLEIDLRSHQVTTLGGQVQGLMCPPTDADARAPDAWIAR